MTARQKAIIAIIVAHLIWGVSTPIIKITTFTIPPFALAFIRFWLTSILLLIYLVFRRLTIKIAKEDRTAVLAWAFFSVPVNIALFFWGITFTTSLDAAVIGSLVPIFTAFAAHFFLGEKLAPLNLLGLIVALVGTLVVIGAPLLTITPGDGKHILGNILILLGALSWVAGTLFAKKIAGKYSPLTLTTIAFVLGLFAVIPLALVEYQSAPWLLKLTTSGLVGIAYVVVGNSIIAYSLFNYALKTISASAANTASYLMPIAAATLAMPLLGEVITTPFLIGSLTIIVGVFFAETRQSFHPLHQRLHKPS